MKTGVVIGVAWASRKVKELDGCRLPVVQPVTSDGIPIGSPIVAADPDGIAASGETVIYVTSTDATQAFATGYSPVNASVVALVDKIS